jgi:hypothetical protein
MRGGPRREIFLWAYPPLFSLRSYAKTCNYFQAHARGRTSDRGCMVPLRAIRGSSMPLRGQKTGPHWDERFGLMHQQPRGKRLTKHQWKKCLISPAYAESLRQRVSDPARWEAFIQGRSWFDGKPCRLCCSTRRHVRAGECFDCRMRRRPILRGRQGQRIAHPTTQSFAGMMARFEGARQEKRGEFDECTVGNWYARSYPTGRLAVSCSTAVVRGPGINGELLPPLPCSPHLGAAPFGTQPATLSFECSDLNAVPPELVHGLAARNPDFMSLLRLASWA